MARFKTKSIVIEAFQAGERIVIPPPPETFYQNILAYAGEYLYIDAQGGISLSSRHFRQALWAYG